MTARSLRTGAPSSPRPSVVPFAAPVPSAASLSLVVAGLMMLGCDGATTPRVGTGSAGAERPPYVACENPSEVRLAPHVCWNPAGSRWRVTASAPGAPALPDGSRALTFDIELMAGGRVRATDDAAGGPATDEWFVQEDVLRIFLANRYVEYRGRLTNGSLLVGDVTNVRGDVWDFRAERQRGGGCPEGELATGSGDAIACYSAAGSRWTVSARGATFVVELGAGGALASDNPSDTTAGNDTWEQAGNQLRFHFDGGATEYTATLSASLDALTGQGTDASGSFTFTAAPVASYPPPFR